MDSVAFQLSASVKNTDPPPIPLAHQWAASYKATPQEPLLDLSQGVPGSPPPQALLSAIGEASKEWANCGYGPIGGNPSLRAALAKEMRVVYGDKTDVVDEDIAITAGCNLAFMAAAMAVAERGDEIILPVPWYFNHKMTLDMLGIYAVPMHVSPDNGFIPRCSEYEALITPRTRAIVAISPNNPTGAIYPEQLIFELGLLAQKHGIAFLIDETYRDFCTEGVPHTLFTPKPEWDWRRHVIHLFSFSKSYCIPGHRLGAVVAAPAFLEQVKTVLDCAQICAPTAIQAALYPLLPTMRPFIRLNAETFQARHMLFRSVLPPGWHVASSGGYFAFIRHPFSGVPSAEVCRKLAAEVGIVFLPATFFGPPGVAPADDRWIRVSVANVGEDHLRQVGLRLSTNQGLLGWPVDHDP